MDRYSKITNKNKREIVLLKSFPCVWGKCSFCDYIEDNSTDEQILISTNKEVLSNITGEFKVLEVINSGSCFELPKQTLLDIKNIIISKNIEKLFLESHWCYRDRLQEMRDFFQMPIIFKTGVETFDNHFRNNILNKKFNFDTPADLKKYFDSPCLMVCIEGQTQEMIARDIEIIENYFDYATVNVFINNTTSVKADENLRNWFVSKYKYLDDNPKIEVLYHNTDFGVGD
ncbi:MAG: radical SAM protein [Epulopiscium sp. Nele67-Bin005]|nr:MAG: radical SAM protein [Epulopiscium sp. Nele67-Bin005]